MHTIRKKQHGFTIVELLIVIVVIGILAAITIVAYNGVQTKARDTARKSDLANISKALQLYYLDNNNYVTTGGGASNGEGWFNSGTPSVLKTLNDAGFLNASVMDPKCGVGSNASCPGYLKANCTIDGRDVTFMFVKLESLPAKPLPSEMASCGSGPKGWWSTYGSNYFVQVDS